MTTPQLHREMDRYPFRRSVCRRAASLSTTQNSRKRHSKRQASGKQAARLHLRKRCRLHRPLRKPYNGRNFTAPYLDPSLQNPPAAGFLQSFYLALPEHAAQPRLAFAAAIEEAYPGIVRVRDSSCTLPGATCIIAIDVASPELANTLAWLLRGLTC